MLKTALCVVLTSLKPSTFRPKVRLGLSLVAASQGDRFEHPAGFNSCIETDSGVSLSIQQ
jgi:hypothetical protein